MGGGADHAGERFVENGRLIRVGKFRGVPNSVAYIVAVADALKAIELIRGWAATPEDEIEDLGPVSNSLLRTLKLETGQFMRLSGAAPL